MDLARGSRRARHVAANATATANTTAASNSATQGGAGGRQQQQQRTHQSRQQQPQHSQQQQQPHRHHHDPPRAQRPQRHSHHSPPEPPPEHRQQQHHPQDLQQNPPQTGSNDLRTPDPQPGDHQPSGGAPPPHPFRLHRVTRPAAHPRLSMPLDSDDSGSEPELSMLGMTRSGLAMEQMADSLEYDDETGDWEDPPEDVEDTSVEETEEQEVPPLEDPATLGLKEISNLGKFTVSSHKQGSGVEELRSDDLKLYWQSDGPQPHRLTVYFVKRVGIRDIRFFVDYTEDESYTPTKIIFKSGTSENNLIEFATMNLESPVGWQQVPLAGAGGEPDGNTLVSYVLQMQILDNHQNGKDTHLRGIKIYAFDTDTAHGGADNLDLAMVNDMKIRGSISAAEDHFEDEKLAEMAKALASSRLESGDSFAISDFLREPELR